MIVAGVTFAGDKLLASIGEDTEPDLIKDGIGMMGDGSIAIDTASPGGAIWHHGLRLNADGAVYGTTETSGIAAYVQGVAVTDEGQIVYEDTDPDVFVSGNPVSHTGVLSATPELVVNGTFDTDVSGWLQAAGSDVEISAAEGHMVMERATGGVVSFPYQVIATVAGGTYALSLDVFEGATSVRVGTSPGNGSMYGANESVGAVDETFVASGGVAYLSLWPVSENDTTEVDNVSITRVV